MSGTIIIDNEYVTLTYYSNTKIVHHEFHQFVHGHHFREALDKGTELLRHHGAQKWLSDNRKRGPLTTEDMDWTQNDWFPRTALAGWKYWALVVPEKIVAQMNMARAISAYTEKGITVELFTDPHEAMLWLESL
jgi:hypothetical protein